MSYYPKVLVFSPTYEGKDYIFKEFYKHLTNLDYPNYDFMIIDNSETLSYVTKLRREGYQHIHHVNRGGNSRQALANAQNYARQKAIDGGYDYVLSLESDLLPPKGIIQRLMSYAKPVVGCLYYIGHAVKVPCVFFTKQKGIITGTRLISLQEAETFPNTGLRRVHGVGLGCTLIETRILKDYIFWHDERFADKHSDVYFYMELENNKVPVFVDTDITVPHYPSKWEDVKDR